jgi:hypothetical protein
MGERGRERGRSKGEGGEGGEEMSLITAWAMSITYVWFPKTYFWGKGMERETERGGSMKRRARVVVCKPKELESVKVGANEPKLVIVFFDGRQGRGVLKRCVEWLKKCSHVLSRGYQLKGAGLDRPISEIAEGVAFTCVCWAGFRTRQLRSVVLGSYPSGEAGMEILRKCTLLGPRPEADRWGMEEWKEWAEHGGEGSRIGQVLAPCSEEMEQQLKNQNPVSPFRVEMFKKYASYVPETLAKMVIQGLEEGWDSQYAAEGPEYHVDWTESEVSEELEERTERTLRKYQDLGFVAGPFAGRPPFPNSHTNQQPVVIRKFAIPKDKWAKDPEVAGYRVIFNSAFPRFVDVNSQQPRLNVGRPYYTLGKFFQRIAQLGPGCVVSFVDVVNCYMNYVVRWEDRARQVVKIRGSYYVVGVGMFGSRCAGDFNDCLTHFVLDVFAKRFKMTEVRAYVDNYVNITPPKGGGEPNLSKGQEEWHKMLCVLEKFGIPLHHHVRPTTIFGVDDESQEPEKEPRMGVDIEPFLGWGGDTVKMVAWVPKKKRVVIKQVAESWCKMQKFSLKVVLSIVGFFRYLNVVLKAFPVVLEKVQLFANKCRRETEDRRIDRETEIWANDKMKIWIGMMVEALQSVRWTVPIIDWEWKGDGADMRIECDAACPKDRGIEYAGDELGGGAWVAGSWFYAMRFSRSVITKSKRSQNLSSSYLEAVNYVMAVKVACARGARRVILVGDCKPAISWLQTLSYKLAGASDETRLCVRELLAYYVQLIIKGGVNVHLIQVDRKRIATADALSRGSDKCINKLCEEGLERVGVECDILC